MTKTVKQFIRDVDLHSNDCVITYNKYISSVANALKNICLSYDLYVEFVSTFYNDKSMVLWLARTSTEDHCRMPVAWHI